MSGYSGLGILYRDVSKKKSPSLEFLKFLCTIKLLSLLRSSLAHPWSSRHGNNIRQTDRKAPPDTYFCQQLFWLIPLLTGVAAFPCAGFCMYSHFSMSATFRSVRINHVPWIHKKRHFFQQHRQIQIHNPQVFKPPSSSNLHHIADYHLVCLVSVWQQPYGTITGDLHR